jgi:hypothetical protein
MTLKTFATTLTLLSLPFAAFADNGKYFSDVISQPVFQEQALELIKNYESDDTFWLKDTIVRGGVEGEGTDVVIDGKTYSYNKSCRPHMCNDYAVSILTSEDGELYMRIHGDEVQETFLGDMNKDHIAALDNQY